MTPRTQGALAIVLLLATGCAGDATTTTATTETEITTERPATTLPVSETYEVPHRLLVDGLEGGGRPWSTALVESQTDLESLVPEATVDREREVVFRFTLAESSTCPFDEMQGLEYSAPKLRLYPVVPLQGDPQVCTDDAMPHTIVVAVDRDELPDGAFSIWVSAESPPSGVIEGATYFAAGELDDPKSEIEPLNAAGDLPIGETRLAHDVSAHCGLDRIYRPIDGRQWVLAENGSGEIDYVPAEWRSAMNGEQIDLVLERIEEEAIMVTPVGTDVAHRYVPAADTEGCH